MPHFELNVDLDKLREVQNWRPAKQSAPTPPAAVAPTPVPVSSAPPQLRTDEEMAASFPVQPCPRCGTRPRQPREYLDVANDVMLRCWCCESCNFIFSDAARERAEQVRVAREKRSKEMAAQNERISEGIGRRPPGGSLGPGRLAPTVQGTPAISSGPPVFGFNLG